MKALSPLVLFLVIYLSSSIIAQDFYKVPIDIAFLIATIYAIAIAKGSMKERMKVFSRGAANDMMVLMIAIFILAGAFAASAKSIGAVDATVNLMLTIMPESFILPGIFIASCFVSLAIGTSCGTIAALTPLAVGIAEKAGIDLPFVIGLVVGGTYFGDNLSVISDTTIIATQTQGCSMRDKFKVNSMIVIPVALILLGVYYMYGQSIDIRPVTGAYSLPLILPYLTVIIASLMGVNVLIVLLTGIVITGAIGLMMCYADVFEWFASMHKGIMDMSELIIVTLMAGGMLELIRTAGGIDYVLSLVTRKVNGRKGAELAIALLTCMVGICTANNTVAMITVGPIARDISREADIDPRKSASILDTASCFTQGILPYSAQILIAAGLASLTPVEILMHAYYPIGIGVALLLSIAFSYPKRYSTTQNAR